MGPKAEIGLFYPPRRVLKSRRKEAVFSRSSSIVGGIPQLFDVRLLEKAVEELHVYRIQVPLERLKIIALLVVFSRNPTLGRSMKHLVVGQERRFPRTQVAKDDATRLLAGIRPVAHALPQPAARGLSWGLHAMAMHIIEPAMVDAAQASIFNTAIAQIRPPVRTVNFEQTHSTLIVAEHHEVFAE
jgi:hypothetical protein